MTLPVWIVIAVLAVLLAWVLIGMVAVWVHSLDLGPAPCDCPVAHQTNGSQP